MNRSKCLVFLLSLFAIGATFFVGWMQSLTAFPAPMFTPPHIFQRISSKIEAKIEAKAAILENSAYVDDAQDKLASGVANVLVGWVDLLAEPERSIEKDENVLSGIGKGVLDAFLNTAGGVLRIMTFPFTNLHVPLPENGIEL